MVKSKKPENQRQKPPLIIIIIIIIIINVDLQIECHKMWNRKVEFIPIIIGATGVVERNIKKYLQRIQGGHNIYSLQRSAILGTAHILRKVLSLKLD